MNVFDMIVSKKVDGAYQAVGKIKVFYPLLSEMGIAVEPEKTDEEGFPIYTDPKVQFIFDSSLAAVKAMARNRLVSGTATLKAGLAIADTVEALLESNSGNRGEALAARRDMLAAFKSFLATTGKSDAVQKFVLSLATNKEALAVVPQEKKDKFAVYLSDFAQTLTDENAARFANILLSLSEACEATDDMEM